MQRLTCIRKFYICLLWDAIPKGAILNETFLHVEPKYLKYLLLFLTLKLGSAKDGGQTASQV